MITPKNKIEDIQHQLREIQLAKIKKLEFELAMQRYRNNPEIWLEERLGENRRTIIWEEYGGYDGHQWDGSKNPLFATWKAVANGNWAALKSATGTGKTFMLARIVLWYLDCFNDPLVVTTAPKEGQLKLHLWSELSKIIDKFKRIRPGCRLTSLRLQKNEFDRLYGASAEAIGFVSGTGAVEESATKAQGFHRENMLIIMEETPGIRDAVMTAFINTSTNISEGGRSKNIILAVGNPDSEDDPLCTFSRLKSVKSFRASALDHPNVVNKGELIPGAVTKGSIKVREDRFGLDTPLYNSRVRGIAPAEATDSLFKGADIDFACDEANWNDDAIPFDNTYNAVGIDVAQSENGDAGGACFGRGNIVCELLEFKCPSASHLGYNLFMDKSTLEKNNYKSYNIPTIFDYDIFDFCIGIDSVGVGVSTLNVMRDNNINAIPLIGGMLHTAVKLDKEGKPIVVFSSLRAQMLWELSHDLKEKKIRIQIRDRNKVNQIRRELLAHRYKTNNGKITVDDKEKTVKARLRGKSPTYADILAYWNWMRKGYYIGDLYTGVSAG